MSQTQLRLIIALAIVAPAAFLGTFLNWPAELQLTLGIAGMTTSIILVGVAISALIEQAGRKPR